MYQLQRDILYWIKDSKSERGISISQIASKVKRSEDKIRVELSILKQNNIIECDINSRGRILRARINTLGESHFSEAIKIVTKGTVREQIMELKERVSSLESAFEDVQKNPTEENKSSFMEKLDTFQSVVNGIAPIIKTGWELLK